MADKDKGKMNGDNGKVKAQPSEPNGDDPTTGSKVETKVTSAVPEKTVGQINPSSPADTGTTPGTNAEIG